MPLQNGRNLSAKPARSKSTSAAGKLPPVVSQESRERAEAVKKAFDRPKTAHRNSRPQTSSYALPTFGNGRLPTSSKNMKLTMKRSNSDTRPLPKIEYGRSASREKLADLRDELFQTKKKVANYELDFKKLNTEMQRLRRDAEKRETFLERIVTAQYHPTELNDTNLARTLTSIKKKEMATENLIEIQNRELERLRVLLKDRDVPTTGEKRTLDVPESASGEESDYPEEPDTAKANGILKRGAEQRSERQTSVSTVDHSVLRTDDESDDEVFEDKVMPGKDVDKIKERNALAKKYAEQNAKLKARLKELKSNYVSMLEKNKKKGEEFVKQSENSKAVVKKTVEISSALETLEKEREDLSETNQQKDARIQELSADLTMALSDVDSLRIHNERLIDQVEDLQKQVNDLLTSYEPILPINIPRLDMTDIDDDICTLHDITERSITSESSEFHHDHLANALAELAGAYCERLGMISQY